jgi:hypothetical protein
MISKCNPVIRLYLIRRMPGLCEREYPSGDTDGAKNIGTVGTPENARKVLFS